MAGINLAEKLIKDKKDEGKVIALGKTIYNEKYLIIQLENDKGIIYQIDYGSDIRFSNNINLEDSVKLFQIDEYSAEWRVIKSGPKQII